MGLVRSIRLWHPRTASCKPHANRQLYQTPDDWGVPLLRFRVARLRGLLSSSRRRFARGLSSLLWSFETEEIASMTIPAPAVHVHAQRSSQFPNSRSSEAFHLSVK